MDCEIEQVRWTPLETCIGKEQGLGLHDVAAGCRPDATGREDIRYCGLCLGGETRRHFVRGEERACVRAHTSSSV